MKILNLKLVMLLEYQNTKTFLQKFTLQIFFVEVFVTEKVKNTAPRAYVINDFNKEEIIETFYEKES